MKKVQEILQIGFNPVKGKENHFEFQGRHQRFLAKVVDYNGPEYVQLFVYSTKMDMRPQSHNYGRLYLNGLKDCISEGSLERDIKRFDVQRIQFFIGYAVPE